METKKCDRCGKVIEPEEYEKCDHLCPQCYDYYDNLSYMSEIREYDQMQRNGGDYNDTDIDWCRDEW